MIVERIKRGRPMKQGLCPASLAREAGVTPPTAAKFLNGRAVRLEIERRLLVAIAKLDPTIAHEIDLPAVVAGGDK